MTRINTSAILGGLENLPTKEKALRKAIDLQKKSQRAEKNVNELKKRLVQVKLALQNHPKLIS